MYLLPDQELLVRHGLFLFQSTGAWPVFQPFEADLAREGIADPPGCLRSMPPEAVRFEEPLSRATEVRLTVRGIYEISRAAPELQLFWTFLRRCADFYVNAEFDSPDQPQDVIADALDLAPANRVFSHRELRAAGLLLEGESVCDIEWVDGPSHWRAHLNWTVRRYHGGVEDYLRSRPR